MLLAVTLEKCYNLTKYRSRYARVKMRLDSTETGQTKKTKIDQVKFRETVVPSLWKEPVNGDLSSQRSLPLEVDTDEKHDQKATVNNSFCSKTKPAGPLGNKGGG